MAFDYELIQTEEDLNNLLVELSKTPRSDEMNPLCLDIETTASVNTPFMPVKRGKGKQQDVGDRFTCELVGLSISWADDKAAYIPLRHEDDNNLKFNSIVESVEKELLERLNPYFTQWSWVNQSERFDWGVVKRRGYFVNYKYCTYLELIMTGRFYNLFQGDQGGSDAGLKAAVFQEFGYQMKSFDDLAGFQDGYHVERVSTETAAWYGCDDSNWARKLHKKIYPEVKDMFLFKTEMAISHLVEVMEENGIPFKKHVCDEQLERLKEFAPQAADIIYSQVERQIGKRAVFDIGNANVTRDLFFATPPGLNKKGKEFKRTLPVDVCLNLPIQKKSRKTGVASGDAKSMAKLAKDYDIVHNVLVYRQLIKADTSFLTTLPEYIHPDTGCIHSTFHQGGVVSGRFASSNPNAQNWSGEHIYLIKDGENRWKLEINVKDAVEVEEDELLVSADFKQVEFWGECEEAKELGMLQLIKEGHDPHCATAALMFGVPIDKVPHVLRKKAKTRNYAMLFGENDESAAAKEGTTVEEQRALRQTHERAIPRIIAHRQEVIAFARKNGYVKTHFGRLVDLTQLYEHPDRGVQEKGDRLAFNSICQGSWSGDLPKIAMARCMLALRNDYPIYPGSYNCVHIPIIHNGHDSLAFRIKRGVNLADFVAKIKWAMEIHLEGFVLPARIDLSVGKKYGSMISYNGESFEEIEAKISESNSNNLPSSNGTSFSLGNRISSNGNNSSIRLNLLAPPTSEQAAALKSLLVQYPGNNIITLSYLTDTGQSENLIIGKFPTSLGIKDADRFGICLPCTVLAEKAEDHLDFMSEQMNII